MKVIYRQADYEDIPSLSELRWMFKTEDVTTTYKNEKDSFLKNCNRFLREAMQSGIWCFWIALIGNEVIANIFIQRIRKVPKPEKHHSEFGYVTNVFTKQEYRGEGIGSELLSRVQKWAEEHSLEFLIAWPSDDSIDWYNRLGFKANTEILEYEIKS